MSRRPPSTTRTDTLFPCATLCRSQDASAPASHRHSVAAWERGFFDDLVIAVGDVKRDGIPRKDTTLEKLAKLPPAFDRTSGHGTLSAGNSSPLTDGAAAIWVGSQNGIEQLPASIPRVRLIDWEIAAIDFRHEGLLMAPARSEEHTSEL